MKSKTQELVAPYKEKLSKIKLLLFDVDGILTDGRVFWAGEEFGYNRYFNIHDGYGIRMMIQAGLKVGIITGGKSIGVEKRFTDLGVHYLYMGKEDKRAALNEILEKENLSEEQALYMGDEFFDLPLLKRVGFSATVPNASLEVQAEVDYITQRPSGAGAGREVIDLLRWAQGITPDIEY